MIPKIIEMESGPPEGMTREQLERILRPNMLALARILAMEIKKDMENKDQDAR
ncbi:hypothetical protein [Thermoanaerobacterium sp. DL9XJH110]|uniref:hypothetical protein n=1 Tax=Thermoanaerobacterium sp. DL9XJH110 TaxID=3386643 RepID=UPI003BB78E11